MDVFKCSNYGQGTWTRVSAFSNLPTWNNPSSPTNPAVYFEDDRGIPYTNTELYWTMMNSSHLNATVDDTGKIHVPALWGLENADGYYYPQMQFMKELVFNPATSQFTIKRSIPSAIPIIPMTTISSPGIRLPPGVWWIIG
jgi:hypothetical protein